MIGFMRDLIAKAQEVLGQDIYEGLKIMENEYNCLYT